jgi:biuret amidohydrolase
MIMDRRTFITGSAVALAAVPAATALAAEHPRVDQHLLEPNNEPMWHMRSRGNRIYEFAPAATALLVIDMQRDFLVGDDGSYAPPLAPIVPRVSQLVAFARQRGVHVVYTREGYSRDLSDVHPFRKSLDYIGWEGELGRMLIRGEPGQKLIKELQPKAGERVIDKAGFSAFHGAALHDHLRRLGVSRIILCGVTTECCVQSTMRDAVDLGYWCLTVADCCASYEKSLHKAALRMIDRGDGLFGWVANLKDLRASSIRPPQEETVAKSRGRRRDLRRREIRHCTLLVPAVLLYIRP